MKQGVIMRLWRRRTAAFIGGFYCCLPEQSRTLATANGSPHSRKPARSIIRASPGFLELADMEKEVR